MVFVIVLGLFANNFVVVRKTGPRSFYNSWFGCPSRPPPTFHLSGLLPLSRPSTCLSAPPRVSEACLIKPIAIHCYLAPYAASCPLRKHSSPGRPASSLLFVPRPFPSSSAAAQPLPRPPHSSTRVPSILQGLAEVPPAPCGFSLRSPDSFIYTSHLTQWPSIYLRFHSSIYCVLCAGTPVGEGKGRGGEGKAGKGRAQVLAAALFAPSLCCPRAVLPVRCTPGLVGVWTALHRRVCAQPQ